MAWRPDPDAIQKRKTRTHRLITPSLFYTERGKYWCQQEKANRTTSSLKVLVLFVGHMLKPTVGEGNLSDGEGG